MPEYLAGKDAIGWETTVLANLHQVAASKTGTCVLRQLQRDPYSIEIKPFYDPESNAGTIPIHRRDAYFKDRPVRDFRDGYVYRDFKEGIGTGIGTAAVVRYTPWRYSGVLQASTLIHEFVHAAEEGAGVLFTNVLGWNFDTTAEFDAILVANIYRSEMGIPRSKSHHHDDPPPTSYKMIPQTNGLRKLIASFRARMPLLTKDLEAINTPFNPLRKGAGGYVET